MDMPTCISKPHSCCKSAGSTLLWPCWLTGLIPLRLVPPEYSLPDASGAGVGCSVPACAAAPLAVGVEVAEQGLLAFPGVCAEGPCADVKSWAQHLTPWAYRHAL